MTTQRATRQWLEQNVDKSLARHTRIHVLPSSIDRLLYIKREDELSSGISGSKLRKYASLIPNLKKRSITDLALVGGPHSNNLVGLLQLLRETKIRPWLFTRETADNTLQGNALFLEMLSRPGANTVVPRNKWSNVDSIANAFLESHARKGCNTLLIPEGTLMPESLPGAITLAESVLQNERSQSTHFADLFIDSGTGLTAIGLILGLSLLDPLVQKRRIHITLIAGNSYEFLDHLDRFRINVEKSLQTVDTKLPQLNFLTPPTGKSFGSVNASLMAATRDIAQREGLLMDPIYSVKHYTAMREYLSQRPIKTPSLFIYNGSSLGLSGFQTPLSQILQDHH